MTSIGGGFQLFDGLVHSEDGRISMEFVTLGLISALGHDTGFIKAEGDGGSGGKCTLVHVERSREFMGRLLPQLGLSAVQATCIQNLISCTGLNVNLSTIPFTSEMEKTAGCADGTADYLGQMSDPRYVEKLPSLYEEYREGNVPGFDSADDLIRQTPQFFEQVVMARLEKDYHGVYRFAASHFGGRDLYIEGIRKNIALIRS